MKSLLFIACLLFAKNAHAQEFGDIVIDTLYKADSVKLDVMMWKFTAQENFTRYKIQNNADTLELQFYYQIAKNGTHLMVKEYYTVIISKLDYYRHCFIEVTGWADTNTINPFYEYYTTPFQAYDTYNFGKPTGSKCWPLAMQNILPNESIYFSDPIIYVDYQFQGIRYKIFNLTGAMIKSADAIGNIDCSELPLGLYVLEIGGRRLKILKR